MADLQCWMNGRLRPLSESCVSPLDRGLLYGDGLFETMRGYGGVIFRADAHIERLLQAAEVLQFPFSPDGQELVSACRATVRANRLSEAYVRLTVTRGVGGRPGELDAPTQPTKIVIARQFGGYAANLYESGMRAIVASVRRNASSALSRVKSLNYLDNALARAEAARDGAEEALLLDEAGNVVEGSASNVFMVSGGRVMTAPVDAGVLDGITRGCVLELVEGLDIDAAESAFGIEALQSADEAFLSNSLMEVMPLTCVDGAQIGDGRPGPMTRKLMEEYRRLVEEETGCAE